MGKITSSAIKSAFRATGVYPPKRVLLCGASEDVGDVSEDVCADTDVSNPPCTECGKVLANKLIKLGIVPPYLADVLLPPPQQKPKKSNRARLSARVLTRVSTESDKDVAISVPAHDVDCNICELDISSNAVIEPTTAVNVRAQDDSLPSKSSSLMPAGPSGIQKATRNSSDDIDNDDDDYDEPCCVCHKSSPPSLKKMKHIQIVNWGQCAKCMHWTHLEFCTYMYTYVKELTKDDVFLCPHCTKKRTRKGNQEE